MPLRMLGLLLGVIVATLFTYSVSSASTRARWGETILKDPSVRLAVGNSHACRLNEDGTIRCWGYNKFGQLGDGSTTDRPAPVLVSGIGGLTPAVAVTAGAHHTCALLVNGTARCWGLNHQGQLGDGMETGETPHPLPVAVSGLTTATAITGTGLHTCALLANGGVRCWGRAEILPSTPVANAVAIAAGGSHSCVLLVNGTVQCWGANGSGQLGDGTTGITRTTPAAVIGLTNVVAITAGVAHSCALLADGTARCWGENSKGELGSNVGLFSPSPVPVVGITDAVAISAGDRYTCALIAAGTARCWGLNEFGRLGDGSEVDQPTAVIVSGLANAVAIHTGGIGSIFLGGTGAATCALLADGSARCWGSNVSGQLGNGTPGNFSTTPVPVAGGGGSITARNIAAGRNHTCAVRANGSAACWGSDASGQLGDGATGVNRLKPVAVSGLTNVVAVAGGDAHTCALLADGTARCWGLNATGQLGDGSTTLRPTPVAVSGITNAIGIAAGGALGGSHTCALLADSTVRCWGANNSGQLGDGTTNPSSIPVFVKNLFNAVAIAAGEFHTCALLANGTVRCWGANGSSQLGDATLSNSNTSAAALASGSNHNCLLRADGTARCWGANLLGQLGNTSTASQPTPASVPNLSSVVSIAGGFGHSCATLADGTARCWGDNTAGQLGNANNTSSPTPVTVGKLIVSLATFFSPLRSVVTVTTGRRHSCALTAGGTVVCWGENTSGQLGNDSITNSNVPVGVPSFTLNIDPQVTLESNGRVTTVTVLAICAEGQLLQFGVTLTQGTVVGHGFGAAQCTGGLARYAVIVPAQGRHPFLIGSAVVAAEATFHDGPDVEEQEWTRQVTIAPPP